MHKAFWDSLAESLQEDPPDYTHALVLLKEIKEVHSDVNTIMLIVYTLYITLQHYSVRYNDILML